MKFFSTVVGLILAGQLLFFGFYLLGGNPTALLNPVLLGMVLFIPIGPLLIAYGFQNAWAGITSLKYLLFTPKNAMELNAEIAVVGYLIKGTYVAAFITFFCGLFITIGHSDQKLPEVMHHLAMSMVSLFYGLIFAEILWRPLLLRLIALNSNPTAPKTSTSQSAAS